MNRRTVLWLLAWAPLLTRLPGWDLSVPPPPVSGPNWLEAMNQVTSREVLPWVTEEYFREHALLAHFTGRSGG